MGKPAACTGISASWCPVHGDCKCPRHTDGAMEGEVNEGQMGADQCPLHSPESPHGEPEPSLDGDVASIIEALSGKRVARSWPYTTPSGHTYWEPGTFAELQERANDAAQAWIETWDPREHPPEPTWAMVGIAQAEVLRLRALLAQAGVPRTD